MIFPRKFRPVCQYVIRNKKPQGIKIFDRKLWQQSGVVYARKYKKKVVYIGVTDGRLSRRIGRHLRLISTSMHATAPRYRKWAEGKRITILAYKIRPVKLLRRQVDVHRAIEAALIKEFKRPKAKDWLSIEHEGDGTWLITICLTSGNPR